ncbi:phage major capsid protein [Streptomyces sp. NPDC057909]|uniref:phage major capsid protein n=1 Tax=Streptomyces sp. NPDC057909 TaxID=3346277 RepID=UPI0036ECC3A4
MSFYDLAKRALEARSGLLTEYKTVAADATISEADKRARLERLSTALDAKGEEVRDFTSKAEAETESRNLGDKLGGLFGGPGASWASSSDTEGRFILPSAAQYYEQRALTTNPGSGGVLVTPEVYNQFLTSMRKRSAFLAAGVNVLPITEGGKLQVPTVTSDGAAGIVAEGSPIPLTDLTIVDSGFTAYKVAQSTPITNELLADSRADVRKGITEALTRTIAAGVDDLFISGTGTNQPIGVTKIAGVVSTALSAAITLDNISDEMTAIEAQGGTVTAILADPATFGVIRKLKASTAGTYHSSPFANQDGPQQVWGANLISAPRLASGTVILMDTSCVYVGLREDVSIAYSDQVKFLEDQVVARVTSRWAGVGLTDVKAVRVLTKTVNGT